MKIKIIESFLTLYEAKNISRASEKLFITQQGLSHQILTLEKELGATLFDRSKSGSAPTALCHELYPHFKAIFSEHEMLLRTISRRQNEQKVITVGIAQGLSSAIDMGFFQPYQEENPDVTLEIGEWSKPAYMQRLASGLLDLLLVVDKFDAKQPFNCELLTDAVRMYAVMHKTSPLADSDEALPFKLLDGAPVFTWAEENNLREFFDYCCGISRVSPNIRVASSFSLDYVNSMTGDTGIAVMAGPATQRITNPDIHIRKLTLPAPGRLYGCTPSCLKGDKAVADLLEYVKQYYMRK